MFRKDDEGEEMFFIKSGKVEICNDQTGQVFVTLSEGSFFGEIALFEGKIYLFFFAPDSCCRCLFFFENLAG